MKLFNTLLAFALVIIGTANLSAQTFEGKVTFKMTYANLPEEMEGFESMLPQEMVTYFKKNKTRVEQSMGMAGNQIVVLDTETNESFILMDLMGQKMQIEISSEDMAAKEKEAPKPKIEYLKDTKKIAGHKCKHAIIHGEDGAEADVYYTKDLGLGVNNQFKELDGYPLQYTMDQQDMEVTITCTELSKEKVSNEMFQKPDASEGYTIMDMDEFQRVMGGGK